MRILVLDDNLDDLRQVRRVLSGIKGVDAVYLQDPELALRKVCNGEVDLLVCDIHMPRMSGSELVRQLREHEQGSWIPAIFLTGADAEFQAQSLLDGGDAVLTKPVIPSMLMAQLQVFRRLLQQRKGLVAKAKPDKHEDELTGLLNLEGLSNHVKQPRDGHSGLSSVLSISIYGLDAYRHVHGDTAADVAVQTAAGAVRYGLNRDVELAARIAEDEFVVFVPDADIPGARRTSSMILQVFRDLRVLTPANRSGHLGLCIGIACRPQDQQPFLSTWDEAAQAMHAAIQAGPNRIALYRPQGKPVIYSVHGNPASGSIERMDG